MRRLIVLLLLATATTGCRKMMDKLEKQGADSASDIPAGGGGNMALGGGVGGGGSGGAAQATRGSGLRTVQRAELHDLHLFLTNAKLSNGRMPSGQETWAAISAPGGNPKLVSLINEQVLYLVPNPGEEGLWAYSREAFQSQGMVLTHSGVETWTSQQVAQALRGG